MVMAYELPTEDERPVLFEFLKLQSSYTTWSRIGPYYKAWVDEAKRLQPIAIYTEPGSGKQSPAIHESDLTLLIKCYAAFEGALAKLRKGDRSAFKWMGYGSGAGYFAEANRCISAWETSVYRGLDWNPVFPLMETEHWAGISTKFYELQAAWAHGAFALQERHLDVPAPIYEMRYMRGTHENPAKPHWLFSAVAARPVPLPPVPAPRTEWLVRTGRNIPFYGIWEPIKAEMKDSFMGLVKKPVVPPDGKFELDGCMNYLHAGSPAPTIAFPEDNERCEGRPTVWRLLWRDDRYRDGTIPEEEAHYPFIIEPTRPSYDPLPKSAIAPAVDNNIVVRASGTPAPHAGIWAAKDQLNVRVTVAQWALLPQHEGRDIEWVFIT